MCENCWAAITLAWQAATGLAALSEPFQQAFGALPWRLGVRVGRPMRGEVQSGLSSLSSRGSCAPGDNTEAFARPGISTTSSCGTGC